MSKIIVIGDTCRDIFIKGKCLRLCPEAPVPVFNPTTATDNEGMAGNVYNNLCSLHAATEIELITHKTETKKTRYIDEMTGYILLRIDEYDSVDRIGIKQFINNLQNFKGVDAYVISDYGKGFLSESDIEDIGDTCRNLGIPTFLDTKKILGDWSRNITFVKINEKEFNLQVKHRMFPTQDCKNLIVTFGQHGSTWINCGKKALARKVHVHDVSGAGDTYLAAFVAEYLKTKDVMKAMEYANLAASIAVSYPGVISVKREDVEALRDTPPTPN